MYQYGQVSMATLASFVGLKYLVVIIVTASMVSACTAPLSRPAHEPDTNQLPVELPTSFETGRQTPPTVPKTDAVSGLLRAARQERSKGRYINAAASLERALRIEPKSALLWNELALVQYGQEEFAQAEQLAIKSNRFAAHDSVLQFNNWLLIRDIRRSRADIVGVEAAEFELRRLQRTQGAR